MFFALFKHESMGMGDAELRVITTAYDFATNFGINMSIKCRSNIKSIIWVGLINAKLAGGWTSLTRF